MNFVEKKYVKFRVLASSLLLFTTSLTIYFLYRVILGNSTEKALSVVACIMAILFSVLEVIVILMGKKKALALEKIAFNENGKINNVFIIAVSVGSIIGLTLTILCSVLLVTKNEEPYITSSLVILSISLFLLINCLIYYLFIILFKKRELKIEDFAK